MKCEVVFIGLLLIFLATANCQEEKFNDFSITAKSDQNITEFNMNCIIDVGEQTTSVRYDLSFYSDNPIENIYLNFYPHHQYGVEKKFSGPFLIIRGVDFGKYLIVINEVTGDYKLDAKNLYQNVVYKDFNKDTRFLEAYILFTFETKNVMELNSINPNEIFFGYNNMKGSLSPKRIYVQIKLPSGYRVDCCIPGNWNEQYESSQQNKEGRFSYWKETTWDGKDPTQKHYGFYFRFFQLQKNYQKEIERLTELNTILIKQNDDSRKTIDKISAELEKLGMKYEDEADKSRLWKIFTITNTVILAFFSIRDRRFKLSVESFRNRKTQIRDTIIVTIIASLLSYIIYLIT